MGGTLLQKQRDEWVVIGYHSKRLPKSAKNFGVTELQTRGRGKPKGKPKEQRQNPPKTQEADETYTYDSPNNYYHNDTYTATSQSQGHRPFNGQGGN